MQTKNPLKESRLHCNSETWEIISIYWWKNIFLQKLVCIKFNSFNLLDRLNWRQGNSSAYIKESRLHQDYQDMRIVITIFIQTKSFLQKPSTFLSYLDTFLLQLRIILCPRFFLFLFAIIILTFYFTIYYIHYLYEIHFFFQHFSSIMHRCYWRFFFNFFFLLSLLCFFFLLLSSSFYFSLIFFSFSVHQYLMNIESFSS